MKQIPWILLSISLVVIIFLVTTKDKPITPPQTVIQAGRDTVRDTIPGKPRLIFRDTGTAHFYFSDTTQLFQNLNELKQAYNDLLFDFNALSGYCDTLKDDTSAFIVVETRVQRNEITNQLGVFENRRPTSINIYPLQTVSGYEVWAGVSTGLKKDFYFQPTVMVGNHKYMVGVGYDFPHKTTMISGFINLNNIK